MGIFGGITAGMTKGLTYIGEFVSDFIWAAEHAVVDEEPVKDLITNVAKVFVSEILVPGGGGLVPNLIADLISGDPFAGSRHAFQQWQLRNPH